MSSNTSFWKYGNISQIKVKYDLRCYLFTYSDRPLILTFNMCPVNAAIYRISRIFCKVLIFAIFASGHENAQVKTRENNLLQKELHTINEDTAKLILRTFSKKYNNAKINSLKIFYFYSIKLCL